MTPSDRPADHRLSRREFLRSAAGVAALGGLASSAMAQDDEPRAELPKRKLGPIDFEATIAALGKEIRYFIRASSAGGATESRGTVVPPHARAMQPTLTRQTAQPYAARCPA